MNLEISSYFHYELRQFIVKCIEENSKNLINPIITEEELLRRKNNILKEDNYGEDIDLFIISNYLDINLVIMNEQFIFKKIFYNNNNLYLNLYFLIENDNKQIEPLIQYKLFLKFPKLCFKVEALVKALIVFNEKNKEIIINLKEKKEDVNKTIPELDNLKLNLFSHGKPDEKYQIINNKMFTNLLKCSKTVSQEILISLINATSASYKRIKFKKYNIKDNEYEENVEDKKEDELLNIEASFVQNIICSNCSKVYEGNSKDFIYLNTLIVLNNL